MLRSLRYYLIIPILFIGVDAVAQDTNLWNNWTTEEIADGVNWKSYHGENYFDSKQSINIIEVDMQSENLELSFAYHDSLLIKTSDFGAENGAVAAINGTFFDMNGGGSVVFFKLDGEVITPGAVSRRLYSESGGVGIDEDGAVSIIQRPEDGWLSYDGVPSILGSGPLLILSGEFRNQNSDAFNQNRHPRTAVGITKEQKLLLVTIDGRSSSAYGMSTPELAEFLAEKGAEYALNLDGGGSTTMWIAGGGVVNYPSGNGQYDHSGERPVANVLLLKHKN